MSGNEPTVELMGAVSGESGGYLAEVWDPSSGTYYFPQTPDMQVDPRTLAREVNADAIAMAFIDSGMLAEHPVIRPRLRHSVDFTGEGPEDLNGHGTLVALLGVAVATGVGLVNVKVLDKSGRGDMSWLAQALDWCAANAEQHNIRVVNLSAGIYHKKWGFLSCKGDCSVCNAARALYHSGVVLVAAAGNEGPNKLPCPQRAGLVEKTFIVVEAIDPVSSTVKDYSGRGSVGAPEAWVRRVPLD